MVNADLVAREQRWPSFSRACARHLNWENVGRTLIVLWVHDFHSVSPALAEVLVDSWVEVPI